MYCEDHPFEKVIPSRTTILKISLHSHSITVYYTYFSLENIKDLKMTKIVLKKLKPFKKILQYYMT